MFVLGYVDNNKLVRLNGMEKGYSYYWQEIVVDANEIVELGKLYRCRLVNI